MPVTPDPPLAHQSIDMALLPSEAVCHMEGLPDEVFALILNLLPIRQVIRCSLLSKRWDAACRYLIRTCESLVIGYGIYRPHDKREPGSDWDRERVDGITLTNKTLVSAMIRSLNQMEELSRLCVHTPPIHPVEISPFIRRFANQLTMLEIDFAVSLIGADVFPHLTRLRCRSFEPKSAAAFPKLAELIICDMEDDRQLPNMQLPSLKKLLITSERYRAWDRELDLRTKEFIVANAANLTVLKITGYWVTLDHAVVFRNLIELECTEMHVVVDGCAFPALTHLMVEDRVTDRLLSILPADRMLSLIVGVYPNNHVVSAISRMRNLKNLMVDCTELHEWTHSNNAVSSIFDNMHQLEKVKLSYDVSNKQDAMIATLVNQNPNLSSVSFCFCRLTDADLTSLAQLQHLTDVTICGFKTTVTTAGVLTLLRGASRKVIRNLSISKEIVEYDQVISEIRLMCEERGMIFVAKVICDYFVFLIRN